MIIFKIFHIKNLIKEARANPGAVAGSEVRDVLWGIVLIPIVIATLGIILFFLIGYTHIFGFQLGFFKFLFWLSLIVSFVIFSVIRRIVKSVGRSATIHTKNVVKALNLENEEK